MRPALPFSVLAAIAVSCTLAGGVFAQDPPKSPQPRKGTRPLRVGVVDIGLLFKGYKRKDSLETVINERREKMKDEVKKEVERIKDLRDRLEKSQLRPGSEPYMRAAMDIKMANYQLELKQEQLQGALKKQVEAHTLQILTELERTIEKYGKKFGYDLILKIDKAEKSAGEDKSSDLVAHFQERIFRAQISDVLYFRGTLDITKNVEKMLNNPANLREMERLAKEKSETK